MRCNDHNRAPQRFTLPLVGRVARIDAKRRCERGGAFANGVEAPPRPPSLRSAFGPSPQGGG